MRHQKHSVMFSLFYILEKTLKHLLSSWKRKKILLQRSRKKNDQRWGNSWQEQSQDMKQVSLQLSWQTFYVSWRGMILFQEVNSVRTGCGHFYRPTLSLKVLIAKYTTPMIFSLKHSDKTQQLGLVCSCSVSGCVDKLSASRPSDY